MQVGQELFKCWTGVPVFQQNLSTAMGKQTNGHSSKQLCPVTWSLHLFSWNLRYFALKVELLLGCSW